MTVRSAAGFAIIEVGREDDAVFIEWIDAGGRGKKARGWFFDEDIEKLIHALAEAINKTATLEDKVRYPQVGTVIRSKLGYLYTRIGEDQWIGKSGSVYPDRRLFDGVGEDEDYYEEVK